MNRKILIFVLTLVSLSSYQLNAKELIKVGTYDFQESLMKMGEEPELRAKFPNVLKENLFLPLMLQSLANNTKKPSSRSLWNDKIASYAQFFTAQSLLKKKEQDVAPIQKSGAIKNTIVLGLALAHQYRGFSIILKPEERILYSNTDLNKNIATSAADYDDTQKQAVAEEKAVDEQAAAGEEQ